MKHLHFISGLPRSGSTLFSAILNQNPSFHANMTSPVGSLVLSLQRGMSQENDMSVFIDNNQRTNILRSVFFNYYDSGKKSKSKNTIFDTNRLWTSKMPLLAHLFPKAKVIACVRHIPWIVDSVERIILKNVLEPSKMFGFDAGNNVYNRFEQMAGSGGLIGFPYQSLREAFYGEFADRLMLIRYDSLTSNPEYVMNEVYNFIGEPIFKHNFDNVEYDATEFDTRLGSPGLHTVKGPVKKNMRNTVLPPDLFARMEPDSFWLDPDNNIKKVKIV